MRIKTEDGEKFTGQLKGYNADSLIILAKSTEQSIAYADMVWLQRSLGIRSYSRDGAIIGFSVGLFYGTGVSDVGLGAGLVGLGGLTGAMVGTKIRREKWKRVDIPDQDAAFVMPGVDDYPGNRLVLENRMRITNQHGEEIIGQIKSLDNTSLTILTDSTELSIAYADIVRLQRSLGVRSYYEEGAMIGLGAGILEGIRTIRNIEDSSESGVGEAILAKVVVPFVAVASTLMGMIVGAAIRTERWERVDIHGQSAASVTPIIGVHPTGRLALGARISF